jgi:hypothetical protein
MGTPAIRHNIVTLHPTLLLSVAIHGTIKVAFGCQNENS